MTITFFIVKISPISFDYAILEKKFKKMVVPLNTNWSDLGTYESLYDVNSSIGDVIKFNTKNSLLILFLFYY